MGCKLVKFYFAIWAVWIAFGLAMSYQEFATHLGSDRWTMTETIEREKAIWTVQCNAKGIECTSEEFDHSSIDFVTEGQVQIVLWMFFEAMIKAPLYFLILMVALYWSIKFINFKMKK